MTYVGRQGLSAALILPSLFISILMVSGCGLITDSDDIIREPKIATIEFYGDPIAVQAPDSVDAGAEFSVTVRTYGGGCVTQGHTNVHVEALDATVTPYDIVVTKAPDNFGCTRELRFFQHIGTLKFGRPGQARVEVRGKREPGGDDISVMRTIHVR